MTMTKKKGLDMTRTPVFESRVQSSTIFVKQTNKKNIVSIVYLMFSFCKQHLCSCSLLLSRMFSWNVYDHSYFLMHYFVGATYKAMYVSKQMKIIIIKKEQKKLKTYTNMHQYVFKRFFWIDYSLLWSWNGNRSSCDLLMFLNVP